jgi:hypothetical protein
MDEPHEITGKRYFSRNISSVVIPFEVRVGTMRRKRWYLEGCHVMHFSVQTAI